MKTATAIAHTTPTAATEVMVATHTSWRHRMKCHTVSRLTVLRQTQVSQGSSVTPVPAVPLSISCRGASTPGCNVASSSRRASCPADCSTRPSRTSGSELRDHASGGTTSTPATSSSLFVCNCRATSVQSYYCLQQKAVYFLAYRPEVAVRAVSAPGIFLAHLHSPWKALPAVAARHQAPRLPPRALASLAARDALIQPLRHASGSLSARQAA